MARLGSSQLISAHHGSSRNITARLGSSWLISAHQGLSLLIMARLGVLWLISAHHGSTYRGIFKFIGFHQSFIIDVLELIIL